MSAYETWWQILVHLSWQASLVAVVLIVLVRWGRRWPSSVRYALLGLAMVKFLLPPWWSFPTGVFSQVEIVAAAAAPAVQHGEAVGGQQGEAAGRSTLLEEPPSPEVGPVAGADHEAVRAPRTEGPAVEGLGVEGLAVQGPAGWALPPRRDPAVLDAARLDPASSLDASAPRERVDAPAGSGTSDEAPAWMRLAVGIHLAGMLLFGALAVTRSLAVGRLRRRSTRVSSGPMRRRLSVLSRRIGVWRTPDLLISDTVEAPISCGLRRPAVVLPRAVAEVLDDRQRDAVIAHELVHQRHGDVWINAIQLFVVVIWWFNPVAWWLARELRAVREDCCDDALLRRGLATDDVYCETLLRVAAELRGGSRPSTAVAMALGEHALARRFRRILDPRIRREGSVPMKFLWMIPAVALVTWPGARWTAAAAEPATLATASVAAALEFPVPADPTPAETAPADPTPASAEPAPATEPSSAEAVFSPIDPPALDADDPRTRFVISISQWMEKKQTKDGKTSFVGLGAWLKKAHELSPDAEVWIVAPRSASAADVVLILEQVTAAGFERVSLSGEVPPAKGTEQGKDEAFGDAGSSPAAGRPRAATTRSKPPAEIPVEPVPPGRTVDLGATGAGRESSAEVRAAIDAGLEYLRGVQDGDGRFVEATDPEKLGDMQLGNSALALLAFLGEGNTTNSGPDRTLVRRGVEALLRSQDPGTGRFTRAPFDAGVGQQAMYGHALATRALVEAFHLCADESLRAPAQKALDHLFRARNPYRAWRYDFPPAGDNDSSMTTACLYAVFAARDAGLEIDKEAIAGGMGFLEEMTDPQSGRTGYTSRGSLPARMMEAVETWPASESEANTAMALLMRLFETPRNMRESVFQAGVQLLQKQLPEWNEERGSIDFVYWYYGTYAMWQVGGRAWETWQDALIPALCRHQEGRASAQPGSWDPSKDAWGDVGGRVYATATNTMTLQVHYRYAKLTGR